jgi:hypothetical protein
VLSIEKRSDKKMRKKVLGILAATVFISLVIHNSFASVTSDMAVTSPFWGTLKWNSIRKAYDLDFEYTEKNVGSVGAWYSSEACLYPWDGGPDAVWTQLPTGETVWTRPVMNKGGLFLNPGESLDVQPLTIELPVEWANYIKGRGGVNFLAYVYDVTALDGTPETNFDNNVRMSWMNAPSGDGGAVGGVVVSVDKFGLLAPYIGLTSTILVTTVATAIYVKRVKRRKEKQ